MPRHHRACRSSRIIHAPLLLLIPLLAASLLVRISASADWSVGPRTAKKQRSLLLEHQQSEQHAPRLITVSSAQGLHAALADASVEEILVAGPLQLTAPVFNATPAGRLDLDREVVLRGVAANAGLHVDRAGKGSREPPQEGWLQWRNRISFVSLELKGLVKLNFDLDSASANRASERFSLWNGVRLFNGYAYTTLRRNGEMFFRNCSVELDPDVESLMSANIIPFRNVQGLDGFQTDRQSPTKFVMSGSSMASPLFDSELEMTVMDMLLYAWNIYMDAQRKGAAAQTLVLWGNDNFYLLWFEGMGIFFFDCRITFHPNTLATTRALTAAEDRMFLLGGGMIEGGAAAESLRADVVAEFQGTKRADCQTIYETDPTWAKAAEQRGMQLPDSFNRFLLGRDYVGATNVTRSGRPCLAWRDIDLPGAEHEFSGIEGNACRNPTSSGLKAQHGVWCFVDSANSSWIGNSGVDEPWFELVGSGNWSKYEWEYCDVPVCEDTEDGTAPEQAQLQSCVADPEAVSGAGPWKVTVSNDGVPCWNWSEIPLLRHAFGRFDDNYCRNPEELGLGQSYLGPWLASAVEPWCFTHRSLRISKCSVPICENTAALPGPGLPEPQATEDQQPQWLLAVGVASGAVAVAITAIAAVLYSWRRNKAKGGFNAFVKLSSDYDDCNSTIEFEQGSHYASSQSTSNGYSASSQSNSKGYSASSQSNSKGYSASAHYASSPPTSIEGYSQPSNAETASCGNFQSPSKGYSHSSHVESKSDVSNSSSLSKVLQSHAVEIVQQSPDALGFVKLLAYLGSGVSSRVERCHWRDSLACCKIIKLNEVLDEVMAYKILFGVEAGLLASLCHPNIVQTYKIYHVMDGHLGSVNREGVQAIWLIQELCAGGSLASKKQEIMESKDSLWVMLNLFRQVALALRFLHEEMKVVHGDLKPENVLLKTDASGTFSAKVADFGLSHVMHGRKHYQPEKLYGDLKFMAPEAVFGKVVSPAMDIWSLGMLIFDMMSPEGVAHDATDPEALLTFLKGPLAVLPDGTPASIQDLVKKCTNRNAMQRPSADEIINELADILDGMGYSSTPPSPEPRKPAPAGYAQSSYDRVIEYYKARYSKSSEPTDVDSISAIYLLPRYGH